MFCGPVTYAQLGRLHLEVLKLRNGITNSESGIHNTGAAAGVLAIGFV